MLFQKKIMADILVLLALAAFSSWYLIETYTASSKIENLIFIFPIGIAILSMCTLELIKQWRNGPTETHDNRDPVGSVLAVMALFAVYVLSLEWLGFDLGTVLFVAAFLALQGERRIHWLVGYSLVFGSLVALFFSNMLPYPMPMTFIVTDY